MQTPPTTRWLVPLGLVMGAFALPGPAIASNDAASAAQLRFCYANSNEDLAARNVTCSAARAIYKRSLNEASAQGDTPVFWRSGIRWSCRAFNPGHYVWRCNGTGKRVVRYRWLSGE